MGCENALGIMTKLQTSLVAEESWVDGAAEKLSALPTATSALELDVSTNPLVSIIQYAFIDISMYMYIYILYRIYILHIHWNIHQSFAQNPRNICKYPVDISQQSNKNKT